MKGAFASWMNGRLTGLFRLYILLIVLNSVTIASVTTVAHGAYYTFGSVPYSLMLGSMWFCVPIFLLILCYALIVNVDSSLGPWQVWVRLTGFCIFVIGSVLFSEGGFMISWDLILAIGLGALLAMVSCTYLAITHHPKAMEQS